MGSSPKRRVKFSITFFCRSVLRQTITWILNFFLSFKNSKFNSKFNFVDRLYHSCCNSSYHHNYAYSSTLQHRTYSKVQYSTVQYSTVRYSTVQYSTVQYSTVPGVHAPRDKKQSERVYVHCTHLRVIKTYHYHLSWFHLKYTFDRIVTKVIIIFIIRIYKRNHHHKWYVEVIIVKEVILVKWRGFIHHYIFVTSSRWPFSPPNIAIQTHVRVFHIRMLRITEMKGHNVNLSTCYCKVVTIN